MDQAKVDKQGVKREAQIDYGNAARGFQAFGAITGLLAFLCMPSLFGIVIGAVVMGIFLALSFVLYAQEAILGRLAPWKGASDETIE